MANPRPLQRVDLFQPFMAAASGPPPIALRVGVTNANSISEGVPMGNVRAETYVLLSALPDELRQRVELAVQMLVSQR